MIYLEPASTLRALLGIDAGEGIILIDLRPPGAGEAMDAWIIEDFIVRR